MNTDNECLILTKEPLLLFDTGCLIAMNFFEGDNIHNVVVSFNQKTKERKSLWVR